MLLSVKNIVGNAKHMKSVMEPTRQHLIILENGLWSHIYKMKKTQILWNESKKNMLSISPYANIFVDRQGRIFCYRETLEKNIMISGMDYKCANELVEYLSVPIKEDELRIKIIKLLGKDADEILELMISQELIEKCG